MKGIITEANGIPKPHDFTIEDKDGNKYFAHLGDIKDNEDFLYGKRDTVTFLKKDDEVEFDIFDKKEKAIHVRKI